jgi:hypothetical protein
MIPEIRERGNQRSSRQAKKQIEFMFCIMASLNVKDKK